MLFDWWKDFPIFILLYNDEDLETQIESYLIILNKLLFFDVFFNSEDVEKYVGLCTIDCIFDWKIC